MSASPTESNKNEDNSPAEGEKKDAALKTVKNNNDAATNAAANSTVGSPSLHASLEGLDIQDGKEDDTLAASPTAVDIEGSNKEDDDATMQDALAVLGGQGTDEEGEGSAATSRGDESPYKKSSPIA